MSAINPPPHPPTPTLLPPKSAERAAVSSCCEEVILATGSWMQRGAATSGQHGEVGQDACRPGVTAGVGKTQS